MTQVLRPGFVAAEVLITVKTYPSPSLKYEETVCVAGVRLDGPKPSWIRLYPVRFRNMGTEYQFKKYERVQVGVRAHRSADPRIESHRPDQDTLTSLGVVAPANDWSLRRNLMGDLIGGTTTCGLIAANQAVAMNEASESLGLIKPTILSVDVQRGQEWDAKQLAKINAASQPKLFGEELAPLQPMPYSVRYRYRCEQPGCGTHTQKVIDWELGQAGRRWRSDRGDAEALRMVRAKWEDEICDDSRDLHFFIGNQHQRRSSFSILGTWWPKSPPLTLF